MGWIIRLKRKQLVGGTGEDDVYPITSTGAVYNEGGKDLDTILRELQEAQYTKVLQEVAKDGNTLHFSYTDETTKDIQLPNAFTDVDLTKSGDDNTITFTFADGTSKSIIITAPEQEQADWTENDDTKDSYIKNKPNVQLKINGNEGEVIYHNGTDVFAQTLMNEGYVATTAEDLAECKNNSPSFEPVFNTWKRFSHKGSVDDYQKGTTGSDYDSWTYISESDTVNQPNNSTAYTGFISAKPYTNYDIKVRVYSNDSDDDFIGMVAAFAKDSNGKEHTLSFLRTTNGTGINFTDCGWICALDFRAQNSKNDIGVDGLQILANKNSVMQVKDTNWATINNNGASTGGTVINMIRTGNVFTAKCSEFGTSELVNESTIIIDLDDATLTSQYPTLNLFKGSAPWGYSTYSQRNSRYENISITDPDNTIYDFVNNKVLQYNSQNQQWEERQGENPYTALGSGRFSFNSITEKLFYNTGKNIIQIPTQIQSDWNELDTNSKAFIKNKPDINAQVQSDWNQTDTEASDYIKNKPAIPVIDGVDIDVTSWGTENDFNYWANNANITPNKKSLLYAVGMSLYYHGTGVYTRIHIKQNFSITTETALNTSNCEIIGHSRTLNMDNHPINLTGRYFKATDLRLQRVADYGNADGNTINTACICQDMDTVSYIVFDNVTFFNWALVATTDIVNDVMYPRTFNFVKVSNVGNSKSLHIICRNCQFPIRPTRFGDTYKDAIMNADYSNTFIKVDIPSNQIGAFSIETTGNVGGVHGTSKSIIGAQKFYVHLASAVKEDMYLFSDGTVDYRYSIGTDTISQNPTPNGYYPNDRCRVWWRINNEQIAALVAQINN